jgi:hypothetical protein
VTCEQIKALNEGQRIRAGKCTIEQAHREYFDKDCVGHKYYLPGYYYFTYVDGCPSVPDTAEEIAEAVNTLNGI